MKNKEFKIVSDEKVIGTINCDENGINIKITEEGKSLCGKGCCQ